ncbi:hypothetical protein [Enterococcus sp.]|uniref:hypothetical protein n=1 Tax=Enterococcus sp. TaxID=35783 RepID=UPI003995D7FC
MTPTQEQIRKLSDKDLIWQKKIVASHLERIKLRDQWLTEEMERRSKDETSRHSNRRARR